MTQQVINIGAAPDDSTGDPLRTSFDKTNDNFTELYAKGATEGLWNFNQTSTDTSTAPVSGRFKTNSGNYRTATQIAIHATTIQGIDRSSTLRTLLVGDLIQCQDKTNAAAWCRYSLQSLPVDHGTWFQLNVTFQADGGVASGDNQEIIFVFTASSGSAAVGAPVGAEYITSTADATLTAERVLTDTATVTWDRTTAGQIKANAAGASATPVTPQGRLTLQTATPVMTTTQAAKTTLFYTPYIGNQIVLYNGTSMVPTTFAELSNLTTASSVGNAGPAAVAASSVYDLFVWSNAGTPTLTRGPAWTNDTTRSAGTALVRVNGILLNAVAITNGPAIQRGTYVGTVRSNASSQLDWIYGGNAIGGTAGFLGIWNAYNRVPVATQVGETTGTWTCVAGLRPLNDSVNNRVSAVFGLSEDAVSVNVTASSGGGATNWAAVAIGINSITTTSGVFAGDNSVNTGSYSCLSSFSSAAPSLGFGFWQALELSETTTTSNIFLGAPPVGFQAGMLFQARM